MQRIYQRFERWRSSHQTRLPIPPALWTSAAEVAREHGVFRTAKILRLEYAKLKRLAESAAPVAKSRIAGGVLRVGRAPSGAVWSLSVGVRHRVGRAARQDAHPVEGPTAPDLPD